MGANRISLDPEVLLSQSQRMDSLRNQYETLFQNVSTVLENMNDNWSENLSHNFSGKLRTARSSFLKIGNLLQIGANAAKDSANTFSSLDECLARSGFNEVLSSLMAGGVTSGGGAGKTFGVFDPKVLAVGMGDFFDVPIQETLDKIKEIMDSFDQIKEIEEGGESQIILQYTKDIIEAAKKNGEGTYLGDRRIELNNRMSEEWAKGDYLEATATVFLGTTEAALNFMGEVGADYVGQIVGDHVDKVLEDPLVSYVNDQIPWSEMDMAFQNQYGFSPSTVFHEVGGEMRKELSSRVDDTLDAVGYISDEISEGFDYIKNLF